jgi:signal transduction histidine kinase
MLLNIIRNMSEIGISIVKLNEDFIRISVKDTGTGMPAQHQDKVSPPFERLPHKNSNIEGTGIGLTFS